MLKEKSGHFRAALSLLETMERMPVVPTPRLVGLEVVPYCSRRRKHTLTVRPFTSFVLQVCFRSVAENDTVLQPWFIWMDTK